MDPKEQIVVADENNCVEEIMLKVDYNGQNLDDKLSNLDNSLELTETTESEEVKSHKTEQNDTVSDSKSNSGGSTLRDLGNDLPRGLWGHGSEYSLSCLGYTVGLGSLWRFPYLVYKNGGGAFLFAYFLFVLTIGIPLLYMEMSLGQYVSQGPIRVWMMVPLFGGLGYIMVFLSTIVASYYNVILSWLFYYLFASMSSPLPWTECNNTWNSQDCCQYRHFINNCTNYHPEVFDQSVSCFICTSNPVLANLNKSDTVLGNENKTMSEWERILGNSSFMIHSHNHSIITPAEEYFHNNVLGLSSGIEDIGIVQWRLFFCLVLAWLAVFAAVSCGIQSFGKVVYFTALAPSVILIALLVKCALLEGAREGVLFYLRPDWDKLKDGMVWKDAAAQVLLSLGPCYGCIITLASYNTFTHNFYRDATLIPFLNTISSMLAGFVVFSCLGHMAWKIGSPLDKVMASDFSLAFIIYPESLAGDSSAIAICFFFLLVLLGIDTVMVFVLTIMTSIVDQFPRLLDQRRYITYLALGTCGVLLVCGIPMTTQGGIYIMKVLDTYTTTLPVFIIGALECLLVTWVCGFAKLQNHIWVMIGKRPGRWWQFMWGILTPLLLIGLFIFTIITYVPLSYLDVILPYGANIACWVLASASFIILMIYGVYNISTTDGSFKERMTSSVKIPKKWGPSGKYADFLNHQFWSLPEYMICDKETGIQHPLVWKRKHSIATTSDGELESISTMEGVLPSPTGAQSGDHIDTGSVQWSEDENKQRGNWTGRFDMLFSGLGYSVGIGNVWRFPYVVYKNGGGSFFVPYVMMVILCGIPLYYMELAMGQFGSVGPITVWRLSPLFKGVGYAALMTITLVCIYYNVFACWSVYYIVASMTSELPWATCNNTWNTENCTEHSFYTDHANETICQNLTYFDTENMTTFDIINNMTTSSWNWTGLDMTTQSFDFICNDSLLKKENRGIRHSPSSEYFFNQVLGISEGIDQPGNIQWHLALCLLFSWAVTFVGLFKGVKSAGKVVYVTVILPYAILIMLLIRFVTLDSSAHLDGIKYYVTPQWSTLGSAGVWGDAATQLFFSLGLSMGGLTALGSYNRFHYDCYRDAYLICVVDTLTSIFAGFVIFAILGVMAKEQGTDVADVVESSFALAYIAYPDAVTRLPGSTAWAILFFLMMFLLAVDSQFLMMETIVIGIMDEFPKTLWKRRIWVILGLCILMFLLGLPLVTQGGIYLLVLVDNHVASWSPLVVGFMTCIVISWVYKADNFCANIKAMLGHEPRWWWKMMWKVITPGVLMFILLFSWVMYEPVKMDNYEYPKWAQVLGIIMALAPIMCIPIGLVVQLLTSKKTVKEAVKDKQLPSPDWGPALEKHRISCYLPGAAQCDGDETMDRIAHWVATGRSNHTPTNGGETNGHLDTPTNKIAGSNISIISGYESGIRNKWYTAAKLALANSTSFENKSKTPNDVKRYPILEDQISEKKKLKVTFSYESDTISTKKPRKTDNIEMVDKSSQIGRYLQIFQRKLKAQNLVQINAEMHSYDNMSFVSEEEDIRKEEVIQKTSPDFHKQASENKPHTDIDETKLDESDSGISSTYVQHKNSKDTTLKPLKLFHSASEKPYISKTSEELDSSNTQIRGMCGHHRPIADDTDPDLTAEGITEQKTVESESDETDNPENKYNTDSTEHTEKLKCFTSVEYPHESQHCDSGLCDPSQISQDSHLTKPHIKTYHSDKDSQSPPNNGRNQEDIDCTISEDYPRTTDSKDGDS